jgi:hypothetical protein
MAVSTTGGGGSFAGPTRSVVIHQLARNTRKDSRPSTSVSDDRVVVGAGLEFLARPDQFVAADISQHAIENARVGFLVGDRATGDSFPITIAVDAENAPRGLPLRVARRLSHRGELKPRPSARVR